MKKCIVMAGLSTVGVVVLSACSMALAAETCLVEIAGQQIDTCSRPNVDAGESDGVEVLITYYTCEDGFCGSTASGTRVHPGTAACDPAWMGRSFIIRGDPDALTYTCEDTGGAVRGHHVDIWFASRAEGRELVNAVGERATIEFR